MRTRGIHVVGEWDSSAQSNWDAHGTELAATLFNGGCMVAKKKAAPKKAAKKAAPKKAAKKKTKK
jgi:hypothetical protein